jgi:hypothetical protein
MLDTGCWILDTGYWSLNAGRSMLKTWSQARETRNKGRIWIALVVGLFVLTFATGVRADLTFPAVFEIVEENPKKFRMSLTVPLINGRYLKVNPVVPDSFRPDDEPETNAGAGTLTRIWMVEADPASLHGEAFGLRGLLGTSQEVRFLLTTLDGRRHETVLRSTRSIFFVPPIPSIGDLSATAARDGLRHSVRHVGMWSWLACVILSGMAVRTRIWIILSLLLGFIVCWSLIIALSRAGLSDAEFRLMTGFHISGLAAGAGCAALMLSLTRSLIPSMLRRWMFNTASVLGAAWAFYEGAGLVIRHGPLWLAEIQRISDRLVHIWFSPFAADWAMAKLRIPFLSLVIILLLVWGLIKIKRTNVRFTVAGCLLLAALALLPYGVSRASVPFMSPEVPSAQQARRIVEPMLSEIYHALNLKDESQTYDRLAEQVSGELVTDLYLDSRRRLVAGTREGAVVEVRQVELQDVGAPRAAEGDTPAYSCRWIVTAKVTHWQHIHQRRNVYEGDLKLAVEKDRWKLAALNLRSEEREVVPGSFESR